MRYFDSLFSIKIFSELRLPYELLCGKINFPLLLITETKTETAKAGVMKSSGS